MSCTQKNTNDIYSKIRLLEFSRNTDTTIFNQFLANKDTNTSALIAESIGRIQDSVHTPTLLNLMHTKNQKVRNAVIFALGQIGTDECEKTLIDLFSNKEFQSSKNEIFSALGKCGGERTGVFLIKNLDTMDNSLKVITIKNLAFIYRRIDPAVEIPLRILTCLSDKSENITNSAIYFFKRNDFPDSLVTLINSNFPQNTLSNKYKLSAISTILQKQSPDSETVELLRSKLFSKNYNKKLIWGEKIHEISILSYLSDSLSINRIAANLNDSNPHIRLASVQALGRIKNSNTKTLLLQYYDRASWQEKGTIILAFSNHYPEFTYRLIQQNLDKGTVYFKELLLQSLANIGDNFSRQQLHQFLIVPDIRLKAAAFQGLTKLYDLTYEDVKPFLFSGDLKLTILACDWISENTEYGNLNDLIMTYQKLKDSQDTEVMASVIETINSLKSKQTIAFLDSIYLNTTNQDIAEEAAKGLNFFNVGVQDRVFEKNVLFLPDSIIYNFEPITAFIQTERGDIELELWPKIAPATISNFVYLANKGFYKGLSFHRVVSDFVIQGGDPRGDGWGGPGYSIPCEYNEKPFIRGSIGMATSGKDTAGSQFFICHSEQPHLNRRYTNFGIVKNGIDIVDNIMKDDKIINIIITN